MQNNETCIHGGVSPTSLLVYLHHSQAGTGRHRCPTCAYEEGFIIGSSQNWDSYEAYCDNLKDAESCKLGSIAPARILSNLGDNQGGTGRHKCVICAFKQGFEMGISNNENRKISVEIVPAPKNKRDKQSNPSTPSTIDYTEREIRNRSLGLEGELFILKNEIEFLKSKGKDDLAERVQHVSVEIGDGLGYDILSFDLSGKEKRIEVKTTRSNISRPFYLTRNELEFSSKNAEIYHLYRLFDFDSKLNVGKYYVIKGNLVDSLDLEPILYLAYPKYE